MNGSDPLRIIPIRSHDRRMFNFFGIFASISFTTITSASIIEMNDISPMKKEEIVLLTANLRNGSPYRSF